MSSFPTLFLEGGVYRRKAPSAGKLLVFLEELTQDNVSVLRRDRSIPHPYKSGVRYHREPKGVENWLGVRRLRKKKRGDCEDLAAYLAAWYRVRKGIHARAILIRFRKGKKVWYHAVVMLPNRRIVDPSKALGM